MSIFRDRYVLKTGDVITPDEIQGIHCFGTGTEIDLYDGRCYIAPPLDLRIDRATGTMDSTGKEIFVGDEVEGDGWVGVVVQDDDGQFVVDWYHDRCPDKSPIWMNIILHGIYKHLTITGMVPWEEK